MKQNTRLILLAALLLAGCTDEDGIGDILSGFGYQQVEFTGYRLVACEHVFGWNHTEFRAMSRDGRAVTGVVCSEMGTRVYEIRIDPAKKQENQASI